MTGKLIERAKSETNPETKSRFAIAALLFEDPRAAKAALALGPDPTYRTAFIHGFQSWHGDLAVLPDLLRVEKPGFSEEAGFLSNSAFRSGVCAALGTIEPESLKAEERQELQQMLVHIYREAPDGATHSAAGWALRQWKVELPAIKETQEPPADSHWFVNRRGMTMLKVEPGTFTMGDEQDNDNEPHQVTITRPFFMCDREVRLDLFQQFVADPDYPATEKPRNWKWDDKYAVRVSPTGDCPIQSVSWFDAVLFCNWLSKQEGRQGCYKRTGEKQKTQYKDSEGKDVEWDVWECDFAANGYRLPTEAEWEYACQAGTRSAYSFGDDEALLPEYGFFGLNSRNRVWPGGSKAPNGWGLFDMHGNVWEWCWDSYGELGTGEIQDPRGSGDTNINSRLLRGGGWYGNSGDCRSALRFSNQPTARYAGDGFRVVWRGGGQDSRVKILDPLPFLLFAAQRRRIFFAGTVTALENG